MTLCFIDFETRCAVPIERGTDNYTAAAECIIATWAVEDAPPRIWDRYADPNWPADLLELIDDPRIIFVAHNSPFDRRILGRSLGKHIPVHRWRCTQSQAYAHGLPGSLGVLGAVLELPEDARKRVDDAHLIRLFCIPNADSSYNTPQTHPAEWARFKLYAVNDTVALREIYRRLPTHNFQGDELRTWWLDQLINGRGFGFDYALAVGARQLLEKAKDRHDKQISDATSASVKAATQRDKLLKWLQASGLALPNLRAATVREWLDHDDLMPEHRFILELRLEAARSSGSKYRRGMEVVGRDGRIRVAKQFNGAGRTGRWSGRGFQPDNLMRPTMKAKYIEQVVIPGVKDGGALNQPLVYGGPNEACGNALRGAIIAAPGNDLIVADFANIESRVLAWIADETWKLEAYRAIDRGEGVDLYILLVAEFFGVPAETLTNESPERQWGKVVDLSCGFLASVGAFSTMAAGYNMDLDMLPPIVLPRASEERKAKAHKKWRRAFLSDEDYGLAPDVFQACAILVEMYRAANAEIFSTGHAVGRACINAVKNPGALHEIAKCRIWSTGSWLIIQLPSGRRLLYSQPKLHAETPIDPLTGKPEIDQRTGRERVYEYLSYLTARGKTWRREKAWAGLFIENIVQAIANDCLRRALDLVHEDTLTVPEIAAYLATLPADERTAISLHVHDEIQCDVPRGSYPLERLISMMTTELRARWPWTRGLPLAAAGWIGPRYHK